MSLNDLLSDMIARINNAQAVKLGTVEVLKSKHCSDVFKVLKEEGFIKDFSEKKNDKIHVSVSLKYDNGNPVIREFSRVSKPGRRVYSQINKLNKYYNGLGVVILSTPKGVLPDHEARDLNIGGEVLCQIF